MARAPMTRTRCSSPPRCRQGIKIKPLFNNPLEKLHIQPSWIGADHDGECGALIVGCNEYRNDEDAIWLQESKKPC